MPNPHGPPAPDDDLFDELDVVLGSLNNWDGESKIRMADVTPELRSWMLQVGLVSRFGREMPPEIWAAFEALFEDEAIRAAGFQSPDAPDHDDHPSPGAEAADDVFVPDPVLIESILREHPGLTWKKLDAMLEAAGY